MKKTVSLLIVIVFCFGCVSASMTTPEGLNVQYSSFYKDVKDMDAKIGTSRVKVGSSTVSPELEALYGLWNKLIERLVPLPVAPVLP